VRVLLIDCYIDDAGSGRFFQPIVRADLDVVRVPFEPLTLRPAEVDAVVVSGSRASANDDEPWVHRSRDFLAEAVASDVPILGVCFGHQLLAAAVGGSVRQRAHAEVGFLPVDLAPDPLLASIGPDLLPFVSHGDEVVASPHLQVLGRSEACDVQAFRVPGRRAWGVQFHLEYDREEQERILVYRAETDPGLGLDPAAEMARGHDTTAQGRRLFDRFLELVGA
jgi:GMP synthase (glutamine-hydrolysing)